MKRKNIVSLIAIVAIIAVAMFTGCVEEEASVSTPIPTPVVTPSPTPTLPLEATPEKIELNVNVFVDNEFWYCYSKTVYPNYVEDTVDEIIEGIILEGKINYEEILITEWIEDEKGVTVTVVFVREVTPKPKPTPSPTPIENWYELKTNVTLEYTTDLSDFVHTIEHLGWEENAAYHLEIFDCSEKAAFVTDILDNTGYDAWILAGNGHAWVGVYWGEKGNYIAIEVTTEPLTIIYKDTVMSGGWTYNDYHSPEYMWTSSKEADEETRDWYDARQFDYWNVPGYTGGTHKQYKQEEDLIDILDRILEG